ncbi:unnamed protein product [Amaranthus hypochondriacus]
MRLKKGKKCFFALKFDLKKAYDSIEWSFIRDSLLHHGFDELSCKLIMSCVSSSSISVLINGSPTMPFFPSRGIRQGDPISPYLFILCMEALSRKIELAVDRGQWKPFSLKGNKASISHLMFADDLLLFGVPNIDTLLSFKDVLQEFSSESGLSANPQKCTIYFSNNSPSDIRKAISDLLTIPISNCLGSYLGFPLLNKRPSLASLHDITRKISNRLASWKSNLLSKAGLLVLINSVLNSIPTYTSSCIRFPKSLSLKIDQIIRNFFWGTSDSSHRKIHLIAWKHISAPKALGGLGIRQNELANQIAQLKLY